MPSEPSDRDSISVFELLESFARGLVPAAGFAILFIPAAMVVVPEAFLVLGVCTFALVVIGIVRRINWRDDPDRLRPPLDPP